MESIHYFDNIPSELTLQILDYVAEPKTARLVCRIWKEIEVHRIRQLAASINKINTRRFSRISAQYKKTEEESDYTHTLMLIREFISYQNYFLPKDLKWKSASINPFKLKVVVRGIEERERTAIINEAQTLCDFGDAFIKKNPHKLMSYNGDEDIFFKANWFRRKFEVIAPNLTTLDLSKCDLKLIPIEIEHFINLKNLYLSNNKLIELPESVGKLAALEHLFVDNNELTFLPKGIGGLDNLLKLCAANNKLTTIPDSTEKLINLQTLWLSRNEISFIPDHISELSSLATLALHNNQLTSIPDSISRLTNLEFLSLSDNLFTSIPECIKRLPNLKTLDIFD